MNVFFSLSKSCSGTERWANKFWGQSDVWVAFSGK